MKLAIEGSELFYQTQFHQPILWFDYYLTNQRICLCTPRQAAQFVFDRFHNIYMYQDVEKS